MCYIFRDASDERYRNISTKSLSDMQFCRRKKNDIGLWNGRICELPRAFTSKFEKYCEKSESEMIWENKVERKFLWSMRTIIRTELYVKILDFKIKNHWKNFFNLL